MSELVYNGKHARESIDVDASSKKVRTGSDRSLELGESLWLVFRYLKWTEIVVMAMVSQSWERAATKQLLWHDVICDDEWSTLQIITHYSWCRRNGVKLHHIKFDAFAYSNQLLTIAASTLRSLTIDHDVVYVGHSDLRVFASLEHVRITLPFQNSFKPYQPHQTYLLPPSVRVLALKLPQSPSIRHFLQANKSMLDKVTTLHIDVEGACGENDVRTFEGLFTAVTTLAVNFHMEYYPKYASERSKMFINLCPNAHLLHLRRGVYDFRDLSLSHTQLRHLILIDCVNGAAQVRTRTIMSSLETVFYEDRMVRANHSLMEAWLLQATSHECKWFNDECLPNVTMLLLHCSKAPTATTDPPVAVHAPNTMGMKPKNMLLVVKDQDAFTYNRRNGSAQYYDNTEVEALMRKENTHNGFANVAMQLFPEFKTLVSTSFGVLQKYLLKNAVLYQTIKK